MMSHIACRLIYQIYVRVGAIDLRKFTVGLGAEKIIIDNSIGNNKNVQGYFLVI